MIRNANLSKTESYYFGSIGTLGALAFLYGAYNYDEATIETGKNLMIHAMTVYLSDKPVYRIGSLIGAVSSIFAPPTIPNVISAASGIMASVEYFTNLNNPREVRGFTF